MKIQQVEELVGITRKNIRFYEDQGLLAPKRAENGYREYHAEDIRRLKQIKFLRKLSVPIEEIRAVFSGERSLKDCLERHVEEVERQKISLAEIQNIAEGLLEDHAAAGDLSLDQLDVDACLENIARLEKEGKEFMNVNVVDIRRKKTFGSILGGGIMIGIMALLIVLMFYGNSVDPLPAPLFIGIVCIPAVIIICVIVVLIQRINEIKGGEEDEAAKY